MIKKNIFFKKRKAYLFYIILFIFLFILFIFYISIPKKFITIYENKDVFFIIPNEKGGKKILNLDKKSLNINKNIISDNFDNSHNNIKFSIQFFASSKYNEVINFLENKINNNEKIYNQNDFYILQLKTEIGTEYYLLYKNFDTKNEAYNYCDKFLSNIKNCLIINAQMFIN